MNEAVELEELLSPVERLANDFINSRNYIREKIKDGKAGCDRCGAAFPAIHSVFICLNDSDEQLLCYPCNYKRLGISIEQVYKDKRSDEERVMLEIQSRRNASNGYEGERPKKKKEKRVKAAESKPDLFSELIN